MTTRGYDIKAKLGGLYNNFNEYTAPPGLAVADNVYVARKNIIGRRPGFDSCSTNLPTAKPQQLMVDNDYLYCHINSQLYCQTGDCNWIKANGYTPLFNLPVGIWFDSSSIFVADSFNHVIRRINRSDRSVSTVAGLPGVAGSANGIGSAARFNDPLYIWGNATDLYVTDRGNGTVRKIARSNYNVTTLAGTAGVFGTADGLGPAASFSNNLYGIWGSATDLYIGDSGNSSVRKVDLAGNVTTFAGLSGTSGDIDGVGAAARFAQPDIIWGDANYLYLQDALPNKKVKKIEIATQTVSTMLSLTSANINFLQGIFGDGTYLYVTQYDSIFVGLKKILIASPNTVTAIAGKNYGTYTGSVDGPPAMATFVGPLGIWGDGSVFIIAESDIGLGGISSIIRQVDATSFDVSLYTGSVEQSGHRDGATLRNVFSPPA